MQNTPNQPHFDRTVFANRSIGELLNESARGYNRSTGVHIYSELRPIAEFEAAKDAQTAQSFLNVIEKYVHSALAAAAVKIASSSGQPFQIRLFEVQGTVLHLYLEGGLSNSVVIAALEFAFAFTKVVYDALNTDMGKDWNGFAICMDHGPSMLVQYGADAAASLVSLGSAANRPAKRLLHGKTPAGIVEVPSAWANLIGLKNDNSEWIQFNLRDRETLSFLKASSVKSLEEAIFANVKEQLEVISNRRANTDLMEVRASHEDVEKGGFTPGNPHRIQAFSMRVDLDGFSSIVEEAFKRGAQREKEVAEGFYQLMQFGDYYEKSTEGAIRLPWAGDCATFVITAESNLSHVRGLAWIAWVEKWHTFASNTDDGRLSGWSRVFPNLKWAAGFARGDIGQCMLAVIEGDNRRFLIASGWPITISLEAQNIGKGGDTIIPNEDYVALFPEVKSLFKRHPQNQKYWFAQNLTEKKVRDAAIGHAAQVAAPTICLPEKATSIQIPHPRPYAE